VAINALGHVVVAGYSTGIGTGTDFTTIKYSQATTGVETAPAASAFDLAQNQPNPFNPVTTIRFRVPPGTAARAAVRIYDLKGRLVAKLPAGSSAGAQEVVWDASGLPSGAYFYTLEAAGLSRTRKMTLMK
jgi:hypothetical protein